ncbi:uncharacterized protein LACBIDRAFT_322397 [Laccaria bicolor S238N-H82]|uniref:Predicted protein n=1 Tax=Laccaria bicolor (strain S238N-H82 / ATCC MYA-4686) TaxID=486041 RepID=B0CW53_LACBS|nr:uncharacterized protein LACBIDRAFT_322397 [Laccaria bicolor S238N-H82]EDR13451.1 predicted protein [Laccaria bicolor S238N-H82]|eukprot:XP_001875949.1 predicted protein [Laccaria bicolor S238N-H82]
MEVKRKNILPKNSDCHGFRDPYGLRVRRGLAGTRSYTRTQIRRRRLPTNVDAHQQQPTTRNHHDAHPPPLSPMTTTLASDNNYPRQPPWHGPLPQDQHYNATSPADKHPPDRCEVTTMKRHINSTATRWHGMKTEWQACIPPTAASLAEAKAAVRHTLSQGKAGPPFCTQRLSVNSPYHVQQNGTTTWSDNTNGAHDNEQTRAHAERQRQCATSWQPNDEQRSSLFTLGLHRQRRDEEHTVQGHGTTTLRGYATWDDDDEDTGQLRPDEESQTTRRRCDDEDTVQRWDKDAVERRHRPLSLQWDKGYSRDLERERLLMVVHSRRDDDHCSLLVKYTCPAKPARPSKPAKPAKPSTHTLQNPYPQLRVRVSVGKGTGRTFHIPVSELGAAPTCLNQSTSAHGPHSSPSCPACLGPQLLTRNRVVACAFAKMEWTVHAQFACPECLTHRLVHRRWRRRSERQTPCLLDMGIAEWRKHRCNIPSHILLNDASVLVIVAEGYASAPKLCSDLNNAKAI